MKSRLLAAVNETFSWHKLTLESKLQPRKTPNSFGQVTRLQAPRLWHLYNMPQHVKWTCDRNAQGRFCVLTLNSRKWITVSKRINRVQATCYKRATIPVDWTTGLVVFGDDFSLWTGAVSLRYHKIFQFKGTSVEKPDLLFCMCCHVLSAALVGTAWSNNAFMCMLDVYIGI